MVCTEIKILEESLFFPVVLVCVSSVSFIMVTRLSKRRSRRRGRRGQVTRWAKGGEASAGAQNIFRTKQLSCASNQDRNYSEVGIVHITDSAALSWLRDNLTDFANIFGKKGFDNRVYNKAKEKAIKKMLTKLISDQKVCDLRMDVEQRDQTVIVNLLGSLYEKHGRRSSSSHRSRSRSYD